MHVQVTGKGIDVGSALRQRIETELPDRVSKYYNRPGEAQVTLAREGIGFECDVTVHLPSGIRLQAAGVATDAHHAFDDALEKIEKRVRRYKRRLRDYHGEREAAPTIPAMTAVFEASDEDDLDDLVGNEQDHVVVAEGSTHLQTLTVGMAVMQLDLSDAPALMFKNAGNGRWNLVYRRTDGHVGWIDPAAD